MTCTASQQSPTASQLRFAVIGLGALGGYYGGLLARSGHEVHFLARSNYDVVAQEGLYVESPRGDFWLQAINVHRRAEDMPVCDVVLVSLKTTDNAALGEVLDRVLVPGGTTLLIQNGLGQEEQLPAVTLDGAVYAGLAFICAIKAAPNRVVHQDYGTLRIAAFRETERAMQLHGGIAGIAQVFAAAGIDVEREPEFLLARWKKLVWNIPFNGLSVVLRANTAEMLACPSTLALVRALMLEVIAAAQAEGCHLDAAYAEQMIEGTKAMKPYYPSMHGDFVAGRALELEAMYCVPIERARRAGREMVRVEMLTRELEFLSLQRDAATLAENRR